MQVLQLSFSGSVSCAALSERGNKTEMNQYLFLFTDFQLDTCSEDRQLNHHTIKSFCFISKAAHSEIFFPFSSDMMNAKDKNALSMKHSIVKWQKQ